MKTAIDMAREEWKDDVGIEFVGHAAIERLVALVRAEQDGPWQTAMMNGLAAYAIDTPVGTPPDEVLRKIIDTAVMFALDPTISEDALALVEKGRAEYRKELLADAGEPWEGTLINGQHVVAYTAEAVASAVAQAVEQYKQDAERYRWLREHSAYEDAYIEIGGFIRDDTDLDKAIDSHIDAAIRASKGDAA